MANNQLKEEIILSTGQFDKNINNVIRKVEELKNKGSKVGNGFNTSMGKMIERATGFNGSMGSLIGVVGRFGGALGVAMGAGEAFNKTISSSQSLTDEYGRVQQSVTTVVDSFFQSLANGDFSPFLNGIDDMIGKAKEAYNAMDELWNMAQSFSVQNARLNNQFQKNLNEIREKKKSNNPTDKARVNELVQENKEIISTQSNGATKLYNQAIETLSSKVQALTNSKIKIDDSILFKISENDIKAGEEGRKRLHNGYLKYQQEANKLREKYSSKKVGGGLIDNIASALNPKANLGSNYQNELAELQEKNKEYIIGETLLFKYSDKELEEHNNLLKQAIGYENTAIQNQSKLTRYTSENASSSKGGKSTNVKGNNNPNYSLGSVGYYENLINDLQKKVKLQVDAREVERLQQMIKEAKKELKTLTHPIAKFAAIDTSKMIPNISSNLLSDLQKVQIPIKTLPTMFKESVDKINDVLDAYDMGVIGAEKAKELIDSINQTLISLGLKPIEVHVETDAEKALESTVSLIDEMGSSFSQLGQALELPQLDIAGMIAGAIASVISGYGTATAQAATLGPIAWLGFGLTGLAQVAAIIAQIHSLSGYANGGIIGGNSYAGDNLLIRANSGEMILNSREQSNLFNLLDKGLTSGISSSNVNFVIRGKDLHGVLNNYNDKMRKVR